ncbi:MAG: YIP1 family protein [Phycisphaerales bacterium]|jgi:hypothetical protein
MECRVCKYALWEIRGRTCPECGTPFAPSEYRFRRGAVRFCCPHCEQEYYGSDENGLLQPREFECAGCARHVTLDEMVLRPVNDLALTRAEVADNPWTIRARVGRFGAFFRTLWAGAITPPELMRITPPESERGLRFAWCVLLAIQLGTYSVFVLIAGGTSLFAIKSSPVNSLMPLAIILLIAPVVALILTMGLWIVAAIAHGVLRLSGPTSHPLRRTVQALAYTCGPLIGCGIPCCGMYWIPVGLVWWGIVAGFAIAAAQKVSAVRAAGAVVVAGLLMLALPTYGFVLLVQAGQAANAALTARATPPPVPVAPASPMPASLPPAALATTAGAALQTHLAANGAWPANAVTLLASGEVTPAMLAADDDEALDQPVGRFKLRDFNRLTSEAKDDTALNVIGEMPKDVIAHRLGLCVFVYHGLPPVPDPGVWLVIRTPSSWEETYAVFKASGESEEAETRDDFDALFQAQNQLRAKLGLRPLPDPDTVTSASGVP